MKTNTILQGDCIEKEEEYIKIANHNRNVVIPETPQEVIK